MADQTQKLAPRFWSEVNRAQNILLTLHTGPDVDSLGSVLALTNALESLGKTVTAITGDDLPAQNLSFLPGYDLLVRKNFTEINIEDYDLFISLDVSSPQQITRRTQLQFPLPIPTIVVDHHFSGQPFGELRIVDSSSSSNSEIVYHLLKYHPQDLITKEVALCLYMGIWGDTGSFHFPATTSQTYRIAAELIDTGIDFSASVSLALRTPFSHLQLMGYALHHLEMHFGRKVITTKIPHAVYQKLGLVAPESVTSYHAIAMHMSECEDYAIAALIHERKPGVINFSLRSNNTLDLRDVAQVAARIGGGGHKPAAGATVSGTVDSAQELLFKTIQEVYPDLGQP